MTPDALDLVRERVRSAVARWPAMTLAEIRRAFDRLLDGPVDADMVPTELAGMPACFLRPRGRAPTRTVLYFHGGGFQIGSLASHRGLMARLAVAADATVLGFEYRLAPEHRHPAAADDGWRAYLAVLEGGTPAGSVAFAGDSAGGALALATAFRTRTNGIPLPACIALISPWLDLSMRGESYVSRAADDIFSKPEQLRTMARSYLGRDPAAPFPSALDTPLSGLPPILVHAGEADITMDDSRSLQARGASEGTEVELRLWPGMFHHFQLFPELAEARRSVAEIGAFVSDRTRGH